MSIDELSTIIRNGALHNNQPNLAAPLLEKCRELFPIDSPVASLSIALQGFYFVHIYQNISLH
jgi:hypothetical protein